jgi:hypothetical protein
VTFFFEFERQNYKKRANNRSLRTATTSTKLNQRKCYYLEPLFYWVEVFDGLEVGAGLLMEILFDRRASSLLAPTTLSI